MVVLKQQNKVLVDLLHSRKSRGLHLKQGRFSHNPRKAFLVLKMAKQWSRFSRQAVQSLALYEIPGDKALSKLLRAHSLSEVSASSQRLD